ncbi:MAG: MBL fold metallo-hydrolase RNA specificity domain-containing protein [Bdellovibrionota bacterium]
MQFLGAVGTVTGSKFLLSDGKSRVLVDCGLFQGVKELRLRNWEPFPVDPKTIDAVILTHAHLDHSGYLPVLVKNGFAGTVFCTKPTQDIAKILLNDAGHLEEEEAAFLNRHGISKHHPAKPLFTTLDAHEAMRHFLPLEESRWTEIWPGWKLRFQNSGHILGSAFVEIDLQGERFVFSGDLGRSHPLILKDPALIEQADYLFVESTYGDSFHPQTPALDELERIVLETLHRKGHLLIPSFAVGRTQDVLYLLSVLRKKKRIPEIPTFVDSPLGVSATEIFVEYPNWHRLSNHEIQEMQNSVTLVHSQQQSQELLHKKNPTIIIAGAGMMTGGRILHHLAARLPDDRNTVLIVGFQAAGTRGRLLEHGIPDLKIHGQYIPVRAKIERIPGLSAHADQGEILSWLGGFKSAPKTTFIVHGEPQAADALRVRIKDKLHWEVEIPKHLEVVELKK